MNRGGQVGQDIKVWRELMGNVTEAALDRDAKEALPASRDICWTEPWKSERVNDNNRADCRNGGGFQVTVSRVLNSSGYVHEQTREKIETIIREYHDSPSASAQSLSKQKTNTIGVLVPELGNTFFTEVLAGVAEVVDENNQHYDCLQYREQRRKREKCAEYDGAAAGAGDHLYTGYRIFRCGSGQVYPDLAEASEGSGRSGGQRD